MPIRVFVYGSLKRGGCYHQFLRDARYLGDHVCAPKYTMLDLGRYPGVIEKGATAIQGEVYAIDGSTLARLDQLEEHPAVYIRRLIDTAFGRAWMYLYQDARGDEPVVSSGHWSVTT